MSTNEEWAGISRMPRTPNVIEGFPYPVGVQALIESMNEAYSLWAEADTALAVAEEDLIEAKALDAGAFAKSVLAGEKDPGEVHTPKAARKVLGAQILANARLVEVNKAGRLVEEAIRENAREVTLSALSLAREGLAERDRLMLEAARLVSDANDARTRGLAGLKEISTFTRGTYQFDPTFPSNGSVTFPSTREERVNKIIDDIERLIELGALFPESSNEVEVLEATA